MTLPNPTRFLALTVTLAALMGCSKKLRVGNYKSPDPAVNPPGTGPITFPFQIPTDSCFVLGDNVSNALDSRYWGALKQWHVLGKVSAP